MKKTPTKVPILTYHHVVQIDSTVDPGVRNSPFTLSREQFYAQMTFLSQNGYQVISMEQLFNMLHGEANGHEEIKKPIVLTFDDGWADNFACAFPILKSFGFTATFFVITGQVDSKNFMTWEQLMEMQNHHMQIESHTHTHTPLELLSKAEIEWEVNHPKEFLEKHLGKQVKFISLPHGSYNRETLLIARKAHYLACATSNFGYATPKTNAYTLPRILLRRNHDISQFARLCEGGTLIWLRERLIHQSKSLIKDAIGIGCYNKLHKIRYRLDHARS